MDSTKPEIDLVFRPETELYQDAPQRICEEYLDKLDELTQPQRIRLHVNGRLDSLSSGCLAILAKTAEHGNHDLEIITYTAQAREVIRILGFDKLVPVTHKYETPPDTETFNRISQRCHT